MDTIEQVGAVLGLAAFLALAVLVLLLFQQAREVRRLREWAGRAPERAAAAAAREEEAAPERAAAADEISRTTAFGRVGRGVSAFGRRMPVDPLYVIAIAIGLVLAIGVVTDGYGLLGGDGGGAGDEPRAERTPNAPPAETTVAVLNATQFGDLPAVAGLANSIARDVNRAGFKVGTVADAAAGTTETVAMFKPGERQKARQVAKRLERVLGPIPVAQMTTEIRRAVGGADVALVIGQDDAGAIGGQDPGATGTEPPVAPGTEAPSTVPAEPGI